MIESFKSTLDEVREADILLHVVDGSSNMAHEYIEVVDTTLEELKATNKRTLLVLNKVDKMDADKIAMMRDEYPEAAFISAERGIGLSQLEEKIEALIEDNYITNTLRIPVSKYKAVAFIHEHASVEHEEYIDSDVKLTFNIAKKDFKQLSHLLDTIGTEKEVI